MKWRIPEVKRNKKKNVKDRGKSILYTYSRPTRACASPRVGRKRVEEREGERREDEDREESGRGERAANELIFIYANGIGGSS